MGTAGRIQNLNEGGARYILEQKIQISELKQGGKILR